jgi:hypothetical protein
MTDSRSPESLRDPSLPRLKDAIRETRSVRRRNAVARLRSLQPVKAVQALRPMAYCPCPYYEPCKAYYLKGWYAYCPSCGTYSPC